MNVHVFTMGSPQWESNPWPRCQLHCHRATKARVQHIHFTDGERGSSCPAPFKEEARHTCYLWHDWLHMTSLGRHASLCAAIRNVLLSVKRRVMLQLYDTIEVQRGDWRLNDISLTLRGWIMIRRAFIVTTVLHEIWFGFACKQYDMIKRH